VRHLEPATAPTSMSCRIDDALGDASAESESIPAAAGGSWLISSSIVRAAAAARLAFTYHFLEILIGGLDYPHIRSSGLRTAEPLKLPFLKHAQELGLKLDGRFANFIQKEGAPVGSLEASQSLNHGSRERASLMPEKLAFQ
jgi:hypothetical protein